MRLQHKYLTPPWYGDPVTR